MKVLFAMGSSQKSKTIADRYYDTFGETLEYKDVFYFKALLDEVKRNKDYNIIVIHEDLEQYKAKDIEQIDRKLFSYVDSITDEVQDADIIYICSDRRTKDDQFIVRLYSIGIYNILIGDDRKINSLCEIIKRPKTKKEAKEYLNIDSTSISDTGIMRDDEVDETQMMNILNYYDKIKDKPEKYVETFDSISTQYSRAQLKVIVSCLPKNIKEAIYNEDRYKHLLSDGSETQNINVEKRNVQDVKRVERKHSQDFLGVFKKGKQKLQENNKETEEPKKQAEELREKAEKEADRLEKQARLETEKQQELAEKARKEAEESIKREAQERANREKEEARLREEQELARKEAEAKKQQELAERARKEAEIKEQQELVERAKREAELRKQQEIARKIEDDNVIVEVDLKEDILKSKQTENIIESNIVEQKNVLEEQKRFKEEQEKLKLEQEKIKKIQAELEEEKRRLREEQEKIASSQNQIEAIKTINTPTYEMATVTPINYKKIVAFVGANKAGTSFMVNAVAHKLAEQKILTSILDMTRDKSMYYIYNQSDKTLRKIARECMQNLSNEEDKYIPVSKYLKVYTTIPGGIADSRRNYKHKSIIETVKNNCNVTIIDADFTTPIDYFENASEIYIVQDMDILKIQETTMFLREMKNRNMDMSKVRIIINKYVKNALTPKRIIEGLSYYKDPEMTFIDTLLSNKVMYSVVPYNLNNYIKYTECLFKGIMNFKSYSTDFNEAINEIANQVFPKDGMTKKNRGGLFG